MPLGTGHEGAEVGIAVVGDDVVGLLVVGLDVGTSVGLRGDWLGLDVGCKM